MSLDASPRIVWHAGEPTAVPVSWMQDATERLLPFAPRNAQFMIQSNGIAISSAWIRFLTSTGTAVGLSIDGPQRFHDARRKTRTGSGTWSMVMKTLGVLQSAGLAPSVITVLQRPALTVPDEFFRFYRDNEIGDVSFSFDEANGANPMSTFAASDKPAMANFYIHLLDQALEEGFPLQIREIERIAEVLTGNSLCHNELVNPWDVIAINVNGDVTSFSPDFMELRAQGHKGFCFGNILESDFDEFSQDENFRQTSADVRDGVELCQTTCSYFGICGGGSPSNKMSEWQSLKTAETLFCKLSIQAPADALLQFVQGRERATLSTRAGKA